RLGRVGVEAADLADGPVGADQVHLLELAGVDEGLELAVLEPPGLVGEEDVDGGDDEEDDEGDPPAGQQRAGPPGRRGEDLRRLVLRWGWHTAIPQGRGRPGRSAGPSGSVAILG